MRSEWTDERLDDLADTIRPLPAEVARHGARLSALEHEVHALRGEMRTEFAAVRGEMREEFSAVRGEMREEFADVRAEMRGGFAQMRQELEGFRQELSAFQRQVTQIGWALVVALIGALVTLAGAGLAAAVTLT